MRKIRAVFISILVILFINLLPVASTAQAQQRGVQSSAAAVAGHYEGVIKTSLLGDVPVKLDLRYDERKLTGAMQTPLGQINVTGGQYADGRLIIRMEANGDEAIFEGQLAGGRLTGDFSGFGQTGKVELKRMGDAPPAIDTRVRLTLSKAEWREDLQFLAREIPRRHKNAFHTVTREQFERAVAELDAQIPNLNDTQIALNLSRIAAMIGDGHTRVNWHWAYPRVPLSFFWFGNELRVVRAIEPYRSALGARVIAIGGDRLAEFNAKARPFVHQGENEWYAMSESAGFLEYPAFLHAAGVSQDGVHAKYTLEDARGKRLIVQLQPLAPQVRAVWLDAARTPPLYRQRLDEPLWYTYLQESETVYFNFKGYPSRTAFKNFSQDLFAFIDKNPVKRLVVDLRQNGGGDFTRGREYIVNEIKKRDRLNRRGRLFVVIGRWTYSAGMANAADFRKETNAILVGEPTGGRPNGYQENRDFMLPNSHLNVWVSTEFYKFAEQDTPGLMPDHRIDPDWPSYLQGRDPVMEWILKQR
jgi:Peptidase family S41